ncbi:unnamed protein product [Closterium sp. NIES-64]|nr:unnamed protein product [Closterium sp. NIES-64]
MYAMTVSAEGDCYLCVPPGPGIESTALGAGEAATLGAGEAAALGASESAAPGAGESALSSTAPVEALHTFTLDSGASRSFSRDSTTLTPLSRPVAVSLVDPPEGLILAHSSTVLPCPDVPVLPPLPPSPAPPCLPCVEGRQRAAPHSSFPPTTAPLQTLHMDVWGPARVCGQDRERYFLLVVDDYTRYTTVFPLRTKGEVPDVLIPWIRAAHLQLRERSGMAVLRLHSDRGGEFASDFLRDFCRGKGIRQSFTFLASPQQNGIAERRIGLVMEVARTSMIHAAAPHFLWPFAVYYAAHPLNLWPCVSLPETSPTLRWTGKVGDASVFRVWGSRAFVRDTTADKLFARAIPCVFLGFVPDAPSWKFYHRTSRRVLPSQDVMFDESVPFYSPPSVDPLPTQGPAPSCVSQVDDVEPVEVAVDSGAATGGGAAGGAEPGVAEPEGAEPERAESGDAELERAESWDAEPECAEPGGAEPERAESGGAEPTRVEPWGAEPAVARSEGAEPGGAEPGGAASAGNPAGALSRREPLSPPELREWFARHQRRHRGAAGTGAAGAAGARGAAGAGVAGGTAGGAGAAGSGGDHTGGTRAAGAGGAPGVGAGGARLLEVLLEVLELVVLRELEPHTLELWVLSDSLRAASPTVTRLLATIVTDPSFESTAVFALVAELVEFAAACRLDYTASLVAASESVCPLSVGGECALGTDVFENTQEESECFATTLTHLVSMLVAPEGDPDAPDIPTPRSYAEAIEGPYSSLGQSAMDAEMAS